MPIKHNPYGWKIKPRKTESQKIIEKEFEIAKLEKQVSSMMNDICTDVNNFINHEYDPVLLLMRSRKVFPEISEKIEEIIKLNIDLYGFELYSSLQPKHLYTD